MFPPYNICEMVTLAKTLGRELLIPEECPFATAHRGWQQVPSGALDSSAEALWLGARSPHGPQGL